MVSSADIMKLRAATGAGMMDSKNALEEAGGDMEKAGEILRKKGIIKAAKRADKIAAEGVIFGAASADGTVGALVEVNSETDFVSGSPDFLAFAKAVAEAVRDGNPADLNALNATPTSWGKTVQEGLEWLAVKTGEKISIRRFTRVSSESGKVYSYLHGAKIGVLAEMTGGTPELGMDVAMHVAASNPKYLNRTTVDATEINKEKDIYAEQLRAQKKPENIIENILKGKIEKFYGEICLLEQPFIKDEEITVGKLAAKAGATIVRFARLELGEGIEKKTTDFAAEVNAQLK